MPSPLPLRLRAWFAVVRAYLGCERRYARLLGRYGFSVAQFDLLNAIARAGTALTPAELAERMLVSRGNVSGLVSRLRRRGWLQVHPTPGDGRSFRCALSVPGQQALQAAQSAAEAFIAEQMAPFDAEALQLTERWMTQMQRHVESIDLDRLVAHGETRAVVS